MREAKAVRRNAKRGTQPRDNKHWLLTLSITLLLALCSFPIPRTALAQGWLSGWDKRVRLTIDHNDVTSALSEFPVLVYLSTASGRGSPQDDLSCVFNELQNNDENRKKIAVTTSDGTTECYVQIERWDSASKKAWLWVRVPSVSSTSDTDLYLYYDKDHADNTARVGDTKDDVTHNVWDTSFHGVWHLNENPAGTAPQMNDSTSNNNHGTTGGPMASGDQLAGEVDGSLNFSCCRGAATPDKYVNCGTASSLNMGSGDFMLEAWFRVKPGANVKNGQPNGGPFVCKGSIGDLAKRYALFLQSTGQVEGTIDDDNDAGGKGAKSVISTAGGYDDNAWHYAAAVRDGNYLRLYVDGSEVPNSPADITGYGSLDDSYSFYIAATKNRANSGDPNEFLNATIDEVRISNNARTAAYVKASYESERDHFIDYGGEQPGTILLTFNNKYVVTSTNAVQTALTSLQDDTEASQTFSLGGSKTVLVIYQANSVHGATMSVYGMQNAISVDNTDYARSWDSPGTANNATRNTVFWIGTLASGFHTIKGRFSSNQSGSTVTVSNRVLLIYILNGDAFLYLDSATTSTTSSSSFVDDPAAQLTFTPPGSCKALILYNIANYYNAFQTEDKNGKKAAINVGGIDYSQAEKSTYMLYYADSVFTVWAMSLSASSTTVKGRFACSIASTVRINRRQLGILMFADTTLLDTISSDTQVSTTSTSLQDDTGTWGFTKLYFRNTNAATGPTGKASPDTDDFPTTPTDKNAPKDMITTKGTAQTSVSGLYNNNGAYKRTMCRIFVGPPLSAQTLTGGQAGYQVGIGIQESNSFMNLFARAFVYVWRPGSGNVKTIISPKSCGNEHGTSETGCVISASGQAGDFSIQANDRIVVEIWWDINNTRSTDYTATDYYDGTTDVAEGTATSNAAGFFYCPQTLYSPTRITTNAHELLVVAMGTKRYNAADPHSAAGECYGIQVDGNDRANSRGCPNAGGVYADSAATAYAERLEAGSHTIKGRFAVNKAGGTAKIDSRRIVALWLNASQVDTYESDYTTLKDSYNLNDIVYAKATDFPSETNWLSGWDKRLRMTLDRADVSSDLTSFPALVYLSTASGRGSPQDDLSCIFNELQNNDANKKKIAVTKSDGTTECFVEIERWDSASKKAWLWVKVPNVNSTGKTQDTALYLYYDKDHADNTAYVGDTDSSAAENVWDSGFKGVWHLGQETNGSWVMKDSTQYNNDGTPRYGAVLGAAGQVGKAVDLDGIDDYVYCPDSTSLDISGTGLTMSAWIAPDFTQTRSQDAITVDKRGGPDSDAYRLFWKGDIKAWVFRLSNPGKNLNATSVSWTADTWHYLTATYDGSYMRIYWDAVFQVNTAKTGSITTNNEILCIAGFGSNPFDGTVDEVRIDDTWRSVSWIKACYESERDHFIDFESEQVRGYHFRYYKGADLKGEQLNVRENASGGWRSQFQPAESGTDWMVKVYDAQTNTFKCYCTFEMKPPGALEFPYGAVVALVTGFAIYLARGKTPMRRRSHITRNND